MKEYRRLSKRERFLIWSWHYESKPSLSFYEISRRLKLSSSTIYDEVNKNRRRPDVSLKKLPYDPEFADYNAARNRILRRKSKYKASSGNLRKVKKLIVEKGWSIPMIAKRGNISISEPTLYCYAEKGFKAFADYTKKKYRRGKVRFIPAAVKESLMMTQRSIDNRPTRIRRRTEFGHWEMDCVDSRKGVKTSVLVLVERVSRFTVTYIIKNKESGELLNALQKFFKKYGHYTKSITTDRGPEFRNGTVIYDIERRGVDVYFAHPYRPEEKGTIERINRDIRKYYPKGTSFAKITETDLASHTKMINEYPREILDWQTPQVRFMRLKNVTEANIRRKYRNAAIQLA
ncbi:IS30 family transposase [Weissella muntiaci]|uniref:IS30 family transposase n=1 Tax=Weissella muntiaci TaxID=2508881 RepID=A0A6C2CCZ5_9LACO|nr:IS30 family transposase [Weissella muntiaci]TYC51105.1 IS30 family transposase [Weissella muntiaci]